MKKTSITHRGPAPNEKTIRMLCAKAAGMCEFPGCQERLFFDAQSAKNFNHSYICHIIGSSPNGPRGSLSKSHQLSDDIENLILLCDKHHTLIDNHVEDYPIETLKDIKLCHEANIDKACNFLSVPKTRIVTFSSPVHGHDVIINPGQINSAVLPERVPLEEYPLILKVDGISQDEQKDVTIWNSRVKQLQKEINTKLFPALELNQEYICDVFAIAPVPLLAKFGELCGSKRSIFLHHYRRIEETWKWKEKHSTNAFSSSKQIIDKHGQHCVLSLSLSGRISEDIVKECVGSINTIFDISAADMGIECIKSQDDLTAFIEVYLETLNRIHAECPDASLIHVFPAVPAVVAIELGRQRMRNVHPRLLFYNALAPNYINTGIKIGEE